MEDSGRNRKFKIAVVGDFMQDRYWIGESTSLSAEVPIPIVKIKEVKGYAGGAGNVAMNLLALGCDTVSISGGGTPVKNRLMVGDHQLARWDENDKCSSASGFNRMVGIDAIVVADYGKGSVDETCIAAVKRHQDVPIFVDTKRDPSVWSGVATAIFPNDKEWNQFGVQYNEFVGVVVHKLGAAGLSMKNQTLWSPATARFIRSVNGAGDTVMAAFVYKYLESQQVDWDISWEDILDFANTAAAIAVEHPYTYAPAISEVTERYKGLLVYEHS